MPRDEKAALAALGAPARKTPKPIGNAKLSVGDAKLPAKMPVGDTKLPAKLRLLSQAIRRLDRKPS